MEQLGGDMPQLGGMKAAPEEGEDLADGRRTISFKAKIENGERCREAEQGLRSEARILERLKKGDREHAGYQRIIELVEWAEASPVMLRMELIEPYGFDMMSMVMKYHKAQLAGGAIAKRCCRQLYDALSYLQVHNVVHGDLKCDNVLIMRTADIKLIDFGGSYTEGEAPPYNWPINSYIAPEVRGRRVPATYAQDMYGVYAIFNEWQEWTPEFPQALQDALIKLGKQNPKERMTLEQLGALRWMRDKKLGREDSSLHLPTVKSSLPLKSGFAMQVTNQVLKMGQGEDANAKAPAKGGGCLAGLLQLLPSCCLCAPPKSEEKPLDPVTIGKAALMAKGGIQVLYIDRRFRKEKLSLEQPEIIRVPEFNTEIAFGDWMFVGFPHDNPAKGQGASVYFKNLSDQAAKFDTQVPDSIPKWFEFDEFNIPEHAFGKCIGPELESLPERNPLREKYRNLNPQPVGYLNLRSTWRINLAGVKREEQTIFFPDATLVFQSGDVGLLVRAETVDGGTEATHSRECLEAFDRGVARSVSRAAKSGHEPSG